MTEPTTRAGGDAADIVRGVSVRLGFGCGELYAGPDRAQSLRLLAAALDSGIAYFDTARLYGHGDAEGLLGAVLKGRRDGVVLASKAGILPTHNPLGRRIRAKAAVLARAAPPMRKFVAEPTPAEPTFGAFGVQELRRSVETSLRALRTDRLDLLLLHECPYDVAEDPEIAELLEALKRAGKIRAWGAATDVETTARLANEPARRAALLQFPSNAWSMSVERIRPLTTAPLITHSVFGAPFRALLEALREPGALRARAVELGVDPDDASDLARRMLALQLQANPDGVVVFSTSKEAHIASNLAALKLDAKAAAAARALARAFDDASIPAGRATAPGS